MCIEPITYCKYILYFPVFFLLRTSFIIYCFNLPDSATEITWLHGIPYYIVFSNESVPKSGGRKLLEERAYRPSVCVSDCEARGRAAVPYSRAGRGKYYRFIIVQKCRTRRRLRSPRVGSGMSARRKSRTLCIRARTMMTMSTRGRAGGGVQQIARRPRNATYTHDERLHSSSCVHDVPCGGRRDPSICLNLCFRGGRRCGPWWSACPRATDFVGPQRRRSVGRPRRAKTFSGRARILCAR